MKNKGKICHSLLPLTLFILGACSNAPKMADKGVDDAPSKLDAPIAVSKKPLPTPKPEQSVDKKPDKSEKNLAKPVSSRPFIPSASQPENTSLPTPAPLPANQPRVFLTPKFAENLKTPEALHQANLTKNNSKLLIEITDPYRKDLGKIEEISFSYGDIEHEITAIEKDPKKLETFSNVFASNKAFKSNTYLAPRAFSVLAILKDVDEVQGVEKVKAYSKIGKVSAYNLFYSVLERESDVIYQYFDEKGDLLETYDKDKDKVRFHFAGEHTKPDALPKNGKVTYAGAALAGEVLSKLGAGNHIHGDFSYTFDFENKKGSGEITHLLTNNQKITLQELEITDSSILTGKAEIKDGLDNPQFDSGLPESELNPKKLEEFDYYISLYGPNAEEVSGYITDGVNFNDVAGFIGQKKD